MSGLSLSEADLLAAELAGRVPMPEDALERLQGILDRLADPRDAMIIGQYEEAILLRLSPQA